MHVIADVLTKLVNRWPAAASMSLCLGLRRHPVNGAPRTSRVKTLNMNLSATTVSFGMRIRSKFDRIL
jgi:hypothetical protein